VGVWQKELQAVVCPPQPVMPFTDMIGSAPLHRLLAGQATAT
jgi:hypothetical protein